MQAAERVLSAERERERGDRKRWAVRRRGGEELQWRKQMRPKSATQLPATEQAAASAVESHTQAREERRSMREAAREERSRKASRR